MIRPATKLRFERTTDLMRKAVKKDLDYTCLLTEQRGSEERAYSRSHVIETAHIFSASQFPSVAKCLENGITLVGYRHSWRFGFDHGDGIGCLDLLPYKTPMLAPTRPVVDRFLWLREHLPDRGWGVAYTRLKLLVSEAREFDREIMAMSSELLDILEGIE